MSPLIIGTAGHVDHGKTALVRALTGTDTDRLPEEKARGISIDIGFAPFVLPSGRRAAIVDVPGHERFIKNMLAGATGIDLVLLVVAADEGVMPQTREHLDILRLLEVRKGLVALTKVDLVDREWIDLVRSDLQFQLRGSFLEGAPIVEVSAVTGQGLDELTTRLDELLTTTPAKDPAGFTRLPIDRIFTRQGFGTVVTGTLVGGTIRLDQRLAVLPQEIEVRVRGLQVHGERVASAVAGQRVAVNLAGVERADLKRGDVLCAPGALRPTRRLSGRLRMLEAAPRPLRNGARVHFHTGTAEVLARVDLLGADELPPGAEGWAQYRTEEAVVVGRGDRYIIRSYSPMLTIGGGGVVEPHSDYRRARAADAIAELQAKERGSPLELVEAALGKAGSLPQTVDEIARRSGLTLAVARAELERLLQSGRAVRVGDEHLVHAQGLEALQRAVDAFFADHFRAYPLRGGASREEVRQKVLPACDGKLWNLLVARLEEAGLLRSRRDRLSPAGREVTLDDSQRRLRDGLLQRMRAGGMTPPSPAEAARGLEVRGTPTEEMLLHLVDAGLLQKVSEDIYFHTEVLDAAQARVRELLSERGRMTTSELREALGTTRKYAVPLLEYFDSIRLTRRVGDERVLA